MARRVCFPLSAPALFRALGAVMTSPPPDSLTDVPGLSVGHFTDLDAATGCTVVLFPAGAVMGVDVRGAAPGTRETDLLRPGMLVQRVQALLLAGGSAFGLAAATGVVRFLEERGVGYLTVAGVVPIVPAAVLYDLALGRADIRPGEQAGYAACLAASTKPVIQGSVGAGTGATVGKILGMAHATKAGLGSAAVHLPEGVVVGALAAVNAGGSVVDPASGRVLAGVRAPDGSGFLDAEALVLAGQGVRALRGTNTTLVLVATDAALDKTLANRLAQVAHDGLARALRPVHTQFDGDVVFAASTAADGAAPFDVNRVAVAAVQAVERAIVRAAQMATSLAGLPAASDLASGGSSGGPEGR